MNHITKFFALIIILMIAGCQQRVPVSHKLPDIETAIQNGQLTLANQWGDSIIKYGNPDSSTKIKLSSIIDMNGRIEADFTLKALEIESRLQKEFGDYSQDDRVTWEKNNWLEYRMIDGEKRYFKRAISNLKLILQSQKSKLTESQGFVTDKLSLFCLEHSQKVLKESKSDGKPVLPVNMKVIYRLTVNADAVPDGKTVRCWLPWPREVHDRQRDVALIKTVPETHIIAPDSVEQRSIYFEQPASKGKPVVFEIQFSYLSMAQYFDLSKLKVLPYDTTSVLFKKYTAEQYPQIVFTNEIKQLSDSIVSGAETPAEKVRKIYYWINNHIIWTGALEYSIMPFIPGYVLTNRRGDCGMQTLLFMTMARYQKIPVKWQSGWMMHPNEVNLHDWCEVFYNGVGWVPLDMSFNLQNSADLHEKEFYISGIDAYRLIVNDAIGSKFVPVKKFPRSEPYDFQRGEVEWEEGNLYFNQWNYEMHVEY
ncbi:MAG TPA: transglutaminase-like domain-containing protein [Prolixibacteraceae bacterium]|nr:transglutaminase-like domain-containing protein [Prolixibacteraceae bacterium]